MRRSNLLDRYSEWVKGIASGIHSTLPADPDVTAEDLEQHGYVGLLEAAERWDADAGVKFTTFAYLRIRGAIYDAMRGNEPLGWRVAAKHREITRTRAMLAQLLGRNPIPVELAESLAITVQELAELERAHWQGIRPVSIDTPIGTTEDAATLGDTLADHGNDPADLYEHAEDIADVRRRVANLPDRDRLVIALHFGENLSYRDIAPRIGVNHSRVQQIINAALEAMRGDDPTLPEAPRA